IVLAIDVIIDSSGHPETLYSAKRRCFSCSKAAGSSPGKISILLKAPCLSALDEEFSVIDKPLQVKSRANRVPSICNRVWPNKRRASCGKRYPHLGRSPSVLGAQVILGFARKATPIV